LTGQVAVAGFFPASNALVRSYGIPNDEAARLNQSTMLQDLTTSSIQGAGTNFSYAFPPYSLTLITLTQQPPAIVGQPETAQTVVAGEALAVGVVATGAPPLRYQWSRDGAPLPQGTNAIWTVSAVSRSDAGLYAVDVFNETGSVVSSNAAVRVLVPSRLTGPVPVVTGGLDLTLQGVDGLTSTDTSGLEVLWREELTGDPGAVWQSLSGSFLVTNGFLRINDPSAAGQPQRFYRVVER
jgi:hypothetical protein